MPTVHVTRQGEMLDLVCQRHYRRTSGVVEAVLEANRAAGLSELPAVLPLGTHVVLPDIPAATVRKTSTIKLWD